MSQQLYSFFLIIAFVRLYVLKISSKHANQLLHEGAIEYGKTTTKWLAILHTLFYFSALREAFKKHKLIGSAGLDFVSSYFRLSCSFGS